ncbi:MAG TPA: VOC family protein [Solirubrobacteraceae bacterium]|nr:VOC family protein [Solirubrobacteraceae bacterium]
MGERPARARLRQAVLVAAELEPVAGALQAALGLREPFRDPGVGEFGLHNAVFALGDCFLEVISPRAPDTAAGRYLERHGDGGYMVIFDLEDLDAAKERAARLGVRIIWSVELPDISGNHLHPADMRGAIVSLDNSRPYGTWRWGGPEWTGRVGEGAPGTLAGVTIAVSEPDAVAARWGEVLGVPVAGGERPLLALDGGEVAFEAAADERGEGLAEISVLLAPGAGRVRAGTGELGGVRLRVSESSSPSPAPVPTAPAWRPRAGA